MKKPLAVVLSLSFLAAACVQPVQYSARDESFLREQAAKKQWRKIAVLPFMGESAGGRIAGEWFAFQVRKQELFEIIDPSLAEIELKRRGFDFRGAEIPVEEARKAGLLLGADGVVVGSIKLQELPALQMGPRVAGVSVIDTATGRIVATSIRSSSNIAGVTAGVVTSATELVAADLLPVLYALAGRTWTPPPAKKPEPKPWGGQ